MEQLATAGLPVPETIVCEGFKRADGDWDIEARIVDTKTHKTVEPYRGEREAGAPVHDMALPLASVELPSFVQCVRSSLTSI